MTETDPEKRLIGYACISTYGQMLDTQLSRAHLRRRRRSGIGRLTDPTAAAQLWLRAGSSCPFAAIHQSHSMITSARESSAGTMVRLSALAVLRLITSSNLVGCSTGKSAALVPRRILST